MFLKKAVHSMGVLHITHTQIICVRSRGKKTRYRGRGRRKILWTTPLPFGGTRISIQGLMLARQALPFRP
jgi:hypothetical protein